VRCERCFNCEAATPPCMECELCVACEHCFSHEF
jgi:hypothetical protein